jgi:hypothetical protein
MPDGEEETEETGYLPIGPGTRVVIGYDDPNYKGLYDGPGTVVRVVNAWTARIRRDADGMELTYGRHLLSAEEDRED